MHLSCCQFLEKALLDSSGGFNKTLLQQMNACAGPTPSFKGQHCSGVSHLCDTEQKPALSLFSSLPRMRAQKEGWQDHCGARVAHKVLRPTQLGCILSPSPSGPAWVPENHIPTAGHSSKQCLKGTVLSKRGGVFQKQEKLTALQGFLTSW